MLRLLWDLCLFRRGPQDVPYSPTLAQLLVLALCAAGLLHLQIAPDARDGFAQVLASVALSVTLPWLLLRAFGRGPRYLQTLIALVGTGVLATLAYLPLAWLAADFPAPDLKTPPTRLQFAVAFCSLVLAAWKLTINGHIWRSALEWPLGAGIGVALGVFVIEFGLLQLLLPG